MNQPTNDSSYADRQVAQLAQRVFGWLQQGSHRLVLAESCTAGLVSAWLGGQPGISSFLCGSSVTYREATKQAWLHIPAELLAEHTAVSGPVTDAMATNVLHATPEATVALAITGHLGPDAPAELDGRIFVSVARRACQANSETAGPASDGPVLHSGAYVLTATDRRARQAESARVAIEFLMSADE